MADRHSFLVDLECRNPELVEIGTAPAQRGFVHVQLRLLSGRSDAVKKELSDAMAAVLHRLTPQPPGMLVQLSVEIADMDRASYYKGRL